MALLPDGFIDPMALQDVYYLCNLQEIHFWQVFPISSMCAHSTLNYVVPPSDAESTSGYYLKFVVLAVNVAR